MEDIVVKDEIKQIEELALKVRKNNLKLATVLQKEMLNQLDDFKRDSRGLMRLGNLIRNISSVINSDTIINNVVIKGGVYDTSTEVIEALSLNDLYGDLDAIDVEIEEKINKKVK